MSDEHAPASRTEEFRGRRAAHNSVVLFASQLGVALIALVTTPIALNKLGLVEFGVWTFAVTVIGYISIADPGFSDIVTRYGAQGRARGDAYVGARVATLGSLVWLGFGVLCAPVVWAITPWLVHLVRLNGHVALTASVQSAAVTFFYWFFAIIIFTSIQATVSAQLIAVGDLWLATTIDVVTRVAYGTILIVLLERGWTLNAIVAATVAQYALAYVATVAAIYWRGGRPYADPRRLDPTLRRQLFRFGGLLQFNSLLDTMTYETDPVVLGLVVGAGASGIWGIANRLGRQVTSVANIPQSNVLPAMSASHAADEGLVTMRRIYVRSQRVIMLTGAFVAGTIVAFGPLLLKAWLGVSYSGATVVSRGVAHPTTITQNATIATVLVAITMVAGLPRQATANAVLAIGRVGLGVRATVIAFVVNLVLTVALVEPFGLDGVLLATVIAKLVATSYFLTRFTRVMECSWGEIVWPWLAPLLIVTTVTGIIGRVVLHFVPVVLASRADSLVALVLFGLGYSLLYTIGLRLCRYFSTEDLEWVRASAPGPIGKVLHPRVVRLLAGPS